jgi:murein DD-endopeptidase MepM/ murein hydrolase activator NlpD
MTRRLVGWLAVALAAPVAGQAPQPFYPQIQSLTIAKDGLFRQQQELVEAAGRAVANSESPGELTLFSYRVQAADNLFSLASRFNVPYETLTTLNGLPTADGVRAGKLLLVPSQPGVFLSLDSPGELDRLMAGWRDPEQATQKLVVQREGKAVNLLFFAGARFHPLERAYFLGILFRFPLPKARLTSSFGFRLSPFTGHTQFHNGIDLAAPTGTEVYAARDGTVVESATNAILGNFLRIDHGDGYETVYGHLSTTLVSLNTRVLSGTIVGKVGSTGMSTGPHLHFEIRRQGQPEDPVSFLSTKP